MRIEILSIKPQASKDVFDLLTLVGKRSQTFQIMVEEFPLGEESLINVSNNRDLWEALQYNVSAISKIHRLVLALYNGEEVSLPAMISEHQVSRVTRSKHKRAPPVLTAPLPAV